VGEGYSGRPGWVATDARFGDVVHAADVFVSGAGMGALELARSAGTPLLVLLGDQPEQARNVAELHRLTPEFALRSVLVDDPDLAAAVEAVTGALPLRCPAAPPTQGPATSAWVQAFQQLVHAARARASPALPAARRRPALGPGLS
jgi:UDP:flavonoid glycosyltransferase YjiC (YdhE family)